MEKWNENCPLCNSPECKIEEITGRKDWNGCGIVVTCNEGMRAEIHQSVWTCAEHGERYKRFNMIYLFCWRIRKKEYTKRGIRIGSFMMSVV